MPPTVRCALATLLALASCVSKSPAASASAAPLYPYWTLARLPRGPQAPEKLPNPTASAVLVTKGYLLTTTEGMGDVAYDFGLDPTVYVFDGDAWHEGRYVDRDMSLHLALIRADVPGTPVRLQRASLAPALILGIAPFTMDGRTLRSDEIRAQRCATAPRWMLEDFGRVPGPSLCFEARVTDHAGAVMLDADGALAGIQVHQTGTPTTAGPNGNEIRAFLDTYFASWGSSVRPKPAY